MFSASVIHGDGRGRLLGYPTANLAIDAEKTHLTDGGYAVWAKLRGVKYKGALVVRRPEQKVEVHLLDYVGPEFYGEILLVDPIQKVTDRWFVGSDEELEKKISRDVALVKDVFVNLTPYVYRYC